MNHLTKLLGLAVLSLAFNVGVHAKTLKIATLAPDGTTWMKELKTGAAAIKQRTDGRVKLKFYPGGVMGNDKSVHRKIKIGQLHGGAFTPSGLSQVYSGVQLYSLPFLFDNFDEVDFVRKKMDPVIQQAMESKGFVLLGITEGGFARILSKNPMQDLDTIRNSKVWLPEGDMTAKIAYDALGISPISLPIADVFTGLQTGLIETIAINPTGAIALQWHSSTDYMTETPLLYLIGMLAVQKKAFNALSPGDQAIVREEMGKVFKRMDRINREENQAAKAALEKHGINFVNPNPGELERWKAISEQSIENMVNSGEIPKDMLEQLRGYLGSIRNSQ